MSVGSTSASTRAAGLWARRAGATHVVLGVPVAPIGVERRVADAFDEVIAVHQPPDMRAVGLCYAGFDQVGDDEVRALLRTAAG